MTDKNSRWNSAELWLSVAIIVSMLALLMVQTLWAICNMRGPHAFDGCDAYTALYDYSFFLEIIFTGIILLNIVLCVLNLPSLGTRLIAWGAVCMALWGLLLWMIGSEVFPIAWIRLLEPIL